MGRLAVMTVCLCLLVGGCKDHNATLQEQFEKCRSAYEGIGWPKMRECLVMTYNWKSLDVNNAEIDYWSWNNGRGRYPRWVTPTDPIDEMKSILRDLAVSEEIYRAKRFTYGRDTAEIPWLNYQYGYTVTIDKANSRGWRASVRHKRDSLQCWMFVGNSAAFAKPPAVREGLPTCA